MKHASSYPAPALFFFICSFGFTSHAATGLVIAGYICFAVSAWGAYRLVFPKQGEKL